MNIPALLSAAQAVRAPHLILPHTTISTFAHLPIPLTFPALAQDAQSNNPPPPSPIKAIVLDKDNCIAEPGAKTVYAPYAATLARLKTIYGPENVLIVSNSAGLASHDPDGAQAAELSSNTGLPVLRHASRKPSQACAEETLQYFRDASGGRIHSGSQVAVVGDRLFADTLLAKRMGAWSVWVRDGVVPNNGFVTKLEYAVSGFLWNRGVVARLPPS